MGLSAIVGIVVVALLAAACWYVYRHPPSAAERRRAVDESRVRAENEISNAGRRPGGNFGGS
jgi:hypothetical protein